VQPSLTGALCTRCGLCCDGSLLGDVEVTSREAVTLEIMGIDVDDADAGYAMALPCPALDGTRCSMYAHRPGACRAFECRLLTRVERGELRVEQALALIASTRKRIDGARRQMAALGQADDRLPLRERYADAVALAAEAPAAAEARRRRRSLEATMAGITRTIEAEFLSPHGAKASSTLPGTPPLRE